MINAHSEAATLFLRKDEERRLLAGHDWIYSNEIDTARSPLKAFEPGQAVGWFRSADNGWPMPTSILIR
jgi:hypothetical protein